MKYDTILETIGHTPRKINRLFGTNIMFGLN
jgi:hypothetical protein